MTVYYAANGITLYCGDARELMARIPSERLTVTDPPYNIGYDYDTWRDALTVDAYADLLRSAVRMPFVMIHYPEALFDVALLYRRRPDEFVAWVYHANTAKQWRGIAWFGCEPGFRLDGQAYQNPTDKRVAYRMAAGQQAALYDWWEIEQVKNVSPEKAAHPCQIPLAVMLRILRTTPEPALVFDPFAGSGTTLLAAQRLGRPAIGIEYSERYCEVIAERLSQTMLPLEADEPFEQVSLL